MPEWTPNATLIQSHRPASFLERGVAVPSVYHAATGRRPDPASRAYRHRIRRAKSVRRTRRLHFDLERGQAVVPPDGATTLLHRRAACAPPGSRGVGGQGGEPRRLGFSSSGEESGARNSTLVGGRRSSARADCTERKAPGSDRVGEGNGRAAHPFLQPCNPGCLARPGRLPGTRKS